MTNRIEQAVGCDDGDSAVKIIQNALGIDNFLYEISTKLVGK